MFERKFGEKSKVLAIRVPESQFESIKEAVYKFVDSYNKDNLKIIRTQQHDIEDLLSVYLDIEDYILKEGGIAKRNFEAILNNHNASCLGKIFHDIRMKNRDFIDNLKDIFSIKRKKPIKTLTEEKEIKRKEVELKKAELRRKTVRRLFIMSYHDYLVLKSYKNKSLTKRAEKLWNACYRFYGSEIAFGGPTREKSFWKEILNVF